MEYLLKSISYKKNMIKSELLININEQICTYHYTPQIKSQQ